MNSLQARLRPRWWATLLATVAFSLTIVALAPRYTDVQVAGSAAVFREATTDVGEGRTIAVAFADMAFVAAYFATAIALLRPNRVSRVGFVWMAIAATADMIENSLVAIGVTRGRELTDGFVDAIRAIGAVKWTTVIVGGVVMLAGLAVDRYR